MYFYFQFVKDSKWKVLKLFELGRGGVLGETRDLYKETQEIYLKTSCLKV